jgi:AraC-like DNA-binding protein
MDILSDTVAAIRTGYPTSGVFVRHAPWGRAYPRVPGTGLHVVLQGSCWVMPHAAALYVVHRDPAHPWTVPELSEIAGVSRATLARRFTATVGEAPLTYVTRWRMLTAARLLRDTDISLAAIARRVGYASEFAFAKAFKREYGSAPGQYRRRPDGPPLVAV